MTAVRYRVRRALKTVGYVRITEHSHDWPGTGKYLDVFKGPGGYLEIRAHVGPELSANGEPYTPERGNSGGWE